MSQKAKLVEKVLTINPKFSEEQAVQIANFALSLSQVYYEIVTKSNQKNKAL